MLLIPTQFEREFIAPAVEKLRSDSAHEVVVELCGFGPVVAAARSAELLGRHQPDQVLLLGIAGSYVGAELAKTYRFASVGCYGIGVGTGAEFQTAQKMGWANWAGDQQSDPIEDVITIADQKDSHQLLSVCAASKTKDDVAQRREAFPNAIAEDMEGFAVAAACRLAKTPLTIVRGISNVAGDRDKSNWKIKEAMIAAWELGEQVIDG